MTDRDQTPRRGLRTKLAAIVGLVSAGLGGGAAAADDAEAATAKDPVDDALLGEINAVRRGHGLRPLRFSLGLDRAATRRARDMAFRGYFSHVAPPGIPFTRIVVQTYPARGYRTWKVGENLYWSTPLGDARRVVRAWLRSPAHRRLLLRAYWREAGIGAVRADRAPGVFGGRPVTIVALDVGVRR